ncbi:MAG TPA: GlsB/YeaQ/YmgE family stress response membrane protein [Actinophytocola sp.]|jgi:uncharacterized membrane protein YeaQ/YmgE (transglycosylase-associated protein family)|uniref:GlsB/YeaQ/YmgE family stress response membrane protein n=1 Tax=Actinophytocola sp. TaxID=1872138 RepID=UPI002F93475D
MDIAGVLSAIVIGLVLGVLGRMVAPGSQKIPIWLTIIAGIVAAFIGTAIARAFGVENTAGIDWLEVIIQVIVAAIVVSLTAAALGRRRKGVLGKKSRI